MALQPPDMKAVQRVLIIKMSALGDIVHALPVAAALGDAYPHLEISWFVEAPLAPLLTGNPYLKEVITLPKYRGRDLLTMHCLRDVGRHLRAVRHRGFDLTLDLQGLTKSATVAYGSGAKLKFGYHWLREIARIVEKPIPHRPESIHIVDQYLDVARFLGAPVEKPTFPIHIPDEDRKVVQGLLSAEGIGANMPFASLNPASARAIKQWGTTHYAELSDALYTRYGLPSVLVTADMAVAKEVMAAAKRPPVSLAGRTTLKQLACVLERSAVHVCGDTGSGHLAAALGRPVVSIIGPTDPERVCPFGQRANAISRREHCGTGCDWRHCEFAHPRCLDAITVAEVADKVSSLLPVSA
ncbi:MAG: lipopolysaccharide heptosyltransferase [Chthonomonadales bacterium]|nr:lipopolysaccharide heptosyltransferase [Chthonomonadales bacterium]